MAGLAADTRESLRADVASMVARLGRMRRILTRAYGANSAQVVSASQGRVWLQRLVDMLAEDVRREVETVFRDDTGGGE